MRVLLVNKFHYLKGGAETYNFALADGLRSQGHEVAHFSMRHPNNVPCEQEKYFVEQREYNGGTSPIKKLEDGLALVYSREAKRNFQALCEDFRPDVIHMSNVHRQITLSILDAPYLRQHKVPVVYTAHDYILCCPCYTMVDGEGKVCDACLDGRFRHCLEKRCVKGSHTKSALAMAEAAFLRAHKSYAKIDRIVCPSQFMKSKLDEAGFSDKTVYLQNFLTQKQVDMANKVFNPEKYEREKPYFLFFGRLDKVKGIETLVRAFIGVASGLPEEWKLKIVGDGPQRGDIEHLLAETDESLRKRIELLGYKSGEELQSIVANARFAVMPSEWRENMPYSGMEALAAGTPIIGAGIGGIPELVSEGETGFVCDPGDAGSLAEAIIRGIAFCKDCAAYRAMQSRCRDYVMKNCDQGRFMERLVEIYQEEIDANQA